LLHISITKVTMYGSVTLLKNQTDLQLGELNTGGQSDCTLFFILRSLSRDQLDELRSDVELHHDCNSDTCSGQLLNPLGNFVTTDFSCFSDIINMNPQENEMDTNSVTEDIQLDDLIVDLSNKDLLQDTPPGSPTVPQPMAGRHLNAGGT
jgi:hypothetical protein